MSEFYNKENLPKGSVQIKKTKKVPFLKTVNANRHLALNPNSTDLVGTAPGTIYGWILGQGTEHTIKNRAGNEWTFYLEYSRPYYNTYEKTTGLLVPVLGKTKEETLERLSRMEFKQAMDHNKNLIEALEEFRHYLEATK